MCDACNICDRPLSDHPDGLACCPVCGDREKMWVYCGIVLCDCGAEVPCDSWNRRAPHAETERLRAENERLKARVRELAALLERDVDALLADCPTTAEALAKLDNMEIPGS